MDEEVQRRRPGRPATGQTPIRAVRIGPVWDEAHAAAAEDGERFSTFVERALRRALDRRARRRARSHPPVGWIGQEQVDQALDTVKPPPPTR